MIKKATVGRKLMDVIDEQEYRRRSTFEEPLFDDTCVEMGGLLYPIRKRYDGEPGVVDTGAFLKYTKPTVNTEQYSSANVIDFTNTKDFRSVMEKQDTLKREEGAILSTVNNIYVPEIYEGESVELTAMKQMAGYKGIDLDSYKHRFGANPNNETRTFRDKKIKTVSFNKVKMYCNVLDVKATLILEDKEGAINPMGRKMVIELTSEE